MTILEIILQIIVPTLTVVASGGWFITYRAYKRKADAESWQTVQDVYEETIEDLKQSCDYIRNDRNLLREENTKLREENNMLRDKYNVLEQQIIELRKELARQGRKLENALPFACGVAGCPNRTRVKFQNYDESISDNNVEE